MPVYAPAASQSNTEAADQALPHRSTAKESVQWLHADIRDVKSMILGSFIDHLPARGVVTRPK